MSKIMIITDSNSGITQDEGKKLGIFVIPMPFTINGDEFLEDINITQAKFYEMLRQNADVKTSQPSQAYLEELWTNLLKTNDELLYIPMMSGLSATCENAKEYAKKFDGKVKVVDNLRISVIQKISVLEAIELAKQGKTADEIKAYLEGEKVKFSLYIIMGVLKYLKKGGRISPAAATIGDILKLKPILYTDGGKFEKYAIAMSQKQAKQKVIQKFKLDLQTKFKTEYEQGKMAICVAYTDKREEGLIFKAELEQAFPDIKVVLTNPLSLSVACHIGPGTVAATLSVNNFATDLLNSLDKNTN